MLDKYAAESFRPRCSETFINPWFSRIFAIWLHKWYSKITRLQQNFGGYFSHARSPIPVKTSSRHVLIWEFAHLKYSQDWVLVESSVTWQKIWKCLNLILKLVRGIIVFLQPHFIPKHFAATTDQDIAPSTVEKSKKMQHTVKKIVDHFAATTEDISPMQLWLDKSSN